MIKIIVISVFTIFQINLFSQTDYTLNALTGRGDLELTGDSYKLQKEAFEAFNTMKTAALLDGIAIEIVSSYRSFEHQNRIWERKYKAFISKGLSPEQALAKIIEYSTLPGTSRHHWGTDIDIIDANVKVPKDVLIEENYQNNGVYTSLKKWMDLNSEKFGFYLVYTNTYSRKGFRYEPWHYSYKKIAVPMLQEFLKIDLLQFFKTINLMGKYYISPKFIEKYINNNISDINTKLK